MAGGISKDGERSRPAPADTLNLFQSPKPVRAFEDIVARIRGLIAEGRLSAGDKLPPERALATRLQVNRHTLREALRTLEISGIIELRRGAHGGAFIVDPEGDAGLLGRSLRFTDVAVADLTQAMRSITVMLLEAALPTIDEADLSAMDDNITRAERTVDAAERSAVNIHFYIELAEATGNRILVEIAQSFCEVLHAWVLRLGSLESSRIIASRRAIIAALRRGDRRAAQVELDRYLDELHHRWLSGKR